MTFLDRPHERRPFCQHSTGGRVAVPGKDPIVPRRRALPAALLALALGLLGIPAAAGSTGEAPDEPVAVTAAAGSISGTVRVPAGADVTKVQVNVVPDDDYAPPIIVFPAPGGGYTATGLPAGQYTVEFNGWNQNLQLEYWKDAEYAGSQSVITLGAGAAVTGIDATMDRGAVVTGRITANGGFDLSRVYVALWGSPGKVIPDGFVMPDGRFTIQGIPSGDYLVEFMPRSTGLTRQFWKNSLTVDGATRLHVVAGTTTTGVDAAMSGPTGAIAGLVRVPAGVDVTDVVAHAEGAGHGSARVPADGIYRIDGLPVGTYAVWFTLGTDGPVIEYWRNADSAAGAVPVSVSAGQITWGVDPYLGVATTTRLRSERPLALLGEAVNVVAEVASPLGTVGGSVELSGPAGRLGTAPVLNGSAIFAVTGLPAGQHTLTARYLGQGLNAASTGTTTQWVSVPAPPTVAVVDLPAGGEGSRVVVRGDGLTDAYSVTFGGRPGGDVQVLSPRELEVSAPAGAGTVPVVVSTPLGSSAPSAGAVFTYTDVVTREPVRVDDMWVAAGHPRCLPVAGVNGVPAAATGVILNVTTVAPQGPGYVVVYPDSDGTGMTPPPATSTVNFEVGADVANAAFVAVPDDGQICYVTRGPAITRILLDVSGYTLDGSGMELQPAQRLLDTRARSRVGALAGPLTPRTVQTVDVAGQAGVPDGAEAVLLNVTVTGATTVGNLRVFPGGSPLPTTSVVNFAPGREKANATVVTLSDEGTIALYSDSPVSASASPVQVILDVVGYVAAGSAYQSVSPTRVIDSRAGTRVGPLAGPLAPREVYPVDLGSVPAVPPGATAVVLNVTAIGATGNGNLRVYPDIDGTGRTPPPGASSLNYIRGRDVPNQVVVALPANGRVDFYSDMGAGGKVHLAVDLVGYLVAPDG